MMRGRIFCCDSHFMLEQKGEEGMWVHTTNHKIRQNAKFIFNYLYLYTCIENKMHKIT